MLTPFLLEHLVLGGDQVHLLPTANVVMVVPGRRSRGAIRFALPHPNILVLQDVAELASLSPNFVKCLIGEPRRHLDYVLDAAEHRMLAPFADVNGLEEAAELLHDLRDSVQVTPDEADFIGLWAAQSAGDPLVTGDRRVQRLCLRYAGQAPTRINLVSSLARTLDADNTNGTYNGLGSFSDASHYARVCKQSTGRAPTAWRNMSRTFY